MKMQSPNLSQLEPSPFMVAFGLVIVIGVLLYFLFMAVDGLALELRKGVATVTAKEHREAERTYVTQMVGNRSRPVPRHIPEMYLLTLDIGDRTTQCAIDPKRYQFLRPGDSVQVAFKQRRITGKLQVEDVAF